LKVRKLKVWDTFIGDIQGFDYMLAFDVAKKVKEHKNLTSRDIIFAQKVFKLIKDTPALHKKIQSLSKLKDEEVVEIKFIYDKLLLITKDEWKRIIDLASQTHVFDNLELANVKAVQNTLLKKEIVKEQALLSAYSSLKKLKKYKIEI